MSMKQVSMAQSLHTDVAWAAGFLDGDGCVSISKQQLPGRKNKTYRLWIRVSQTREATLKHFQEVLGLQSVITVTGPNARQNKQIFSLTYEGHHAIAALQSLSPYLVLTASQAEAAMKFWHEGRMGTLPGPRGFEQEVWDKRDYWFNELRRLK